MLSLADLEPEVVCLIAEYVDDSSPRSTKALACVNKYLNEVTKLIAHRHKTLFVEQLVANRALKNTWDDDILHATNIRTLTIKNSKTPGYHYTSIHDDCWGHIVALLSKIGRLRQMTWSAKYPIPLMVLQALEQYHKTATLHIYNYVRDSTSIDGPSQVEQWLAHSPALTHIRTTYSSQLRGSLWVTYLAFRYIVGSAPNLIYAGSIRPKDAYSDHVGALTDPDRAQIRSAFQTNKSPSSSIRKLTLDGYNMSRDVLTQWSSIVDLSSLHDLKFSRGDPSLDYFQCAASILTDLKQLSLNLRSVPHEFAGEQRVGLAKAVADYIKECSPLQSLSLWSWNGIVDLSDILERHGQTLISLQLHERDDWQHRRTLLSVDDLIKIRNSCPNLRDLTFDLCRHDPRLHWATDVNKQYYEELVKFPHLSSLQIYFDAGLEYLFDQYIDDDIQPYDFDEHSVNEFERDDATGSTFNDGRPLPASTRVLARDTTIQNSNEPEHDNNSNAPTSSTRYILRTGYDYCEHVRPSRDSYLEPYVTNIWKTVFQNKPFGPRRLDVKVGEWEGRQVDRPYPDQSAEWEFRRHLVVRPHERDDVFEPSVVVHKLKSRTTHNDVGN